MAAVDRLSAPKNSRYVFCEARQDLQDFQDRQVQMAPEDDRMNRGKSLEAFWGQTNTSKRIILTA